MIGCVGVYERLCKCALWCMRGHERMCVRMCLVLCMHLPNGFLWSPSPKLIRVVQTVIVLIHRHAYRVRGCIMRVYYEGYGGMRGGCVGMRG